ncbi:hypothetical protein niasHS_012295 [Heterodera schachtii]|uniref:Nudix hydrolase domain-containing protein n=1 Tax=Heterodera schachtii TaxID=97005 RepID=A0ABD2IP61_HETSC
MPKSNNKRGRMSPTLDEQDDILLRLDRLETLIKTAPTSNSSIIERLERLESLVQKLVDGKVVGEGPNRSADHTPTSNPPPWGQPPPHLQGMVTQMVSNAVMESEEIIAKSKRAVLEKVPEQIDATVLVREIAEECGITAEVKFEQIHRHPKTPTGKNRIIKIPFSDKKYRGIFLKSFRKKLLKINKYPKNISVRRDLTRSELNVLYDLRRKAYAMNQSENLYKYVVIDLAIVTLNSPRPLRTH